MMGLEFFKAASILALLIAISLDPALEFEVYDSHLGKIINVSEATYDENATKYDEYLKDYIDMATLSEFAEFQPAEASVRPVFRPQASTWHIATPGEVPYLAVIFAQNNVTKQFQLCGGALLTRDSVLTICACVCSWSYMMWKGEKYDGPLKPAPWKPLEEYDIMSKDLYIQAGLVTLNLLTPNHIIEEELVQVSECVAFGFDIMNKTVTDEKLWLKKFAILRVNSVMYDLQLDFVVPWPPVHLLYHNIDENNDGVHDQVKKKWPKSFILVSTIAFKTRLRNESLALYNTFYEPVDLETQAVLMNHVMCNMSFCSKIVPLSYADTSRCFCEYLEVDFHVDICGSGIGWPIILHGRFVGLSGWPIRDCRDPSRNFFGTIVTSKLMDAIRFVLPEVTQEPYVPKLPRERNLFLEYDFLLPYQFFKAAQTPEPESELIKLNLQPKSTSSQIFISASCWAAYALIVFI